MNPAPLLTLRKIDFKFDIDNCTQDPLCGLGAELGKFSGINNFEEIMLRIQVWHCWCKTGDEWGALDAALATGFPMLKRVSIDITIYAYSIGIRYKEAFCRLLRAQFPRLSTSSTVSFDISTTVHIFGSSISRLLSV